MQPYKRKRTIKDVDLPFVVCTLLYGVMYSYVYMFLDRTLADAPHIDTELLINNSYYNYTSISFMHPPV